MNSLVPTYVYCLGSCTDPLRLLRYLITPNLLAFSASSPATRASEWASSSAPDYHAKISQSRNSCLHWSRNRHFWVPVHFWPCWSAAWLVNVESAGLAESFCPRSGSVLRVNTVQVDINPVRTLRDTLQFSEERCHSWLLSRTGIGKLWPVGQTQPIVCFCK